MGKHRRAEIRTRRHALAWALHTVLTGDPQPALRGRGRGVPDGPRGRRRTQGGRRPVTTGPRVLLP
jgi:hypothetical protein